MARRLKTAEAAALIVIATLAQPVIYHVPGGRWYDRTKIDEAKGERFFCSEAEAKQSGWRRSSQ